MNVIKEVDLRQLCRICAVDVSNDVSQHFLIESNEITDLGETFISCLGIQLMKDGYPDRVCNYCHLQLNMFHAFVKKANTTSDQFAKIIQDAMPVDPIEEVEAETEAKLEPEPESESISVDEMEFELEPVETNDQNLETDLELIIKGDDPSGTPEIENDGEYTIEYLETEYMSNFEDEVSQNDGDVSEKNDNQIKTAASKTLKSATDARKRTYPYKCKKCSKRFVYKEVYEAHIRIHKGLPAFSCPHCPKTFKEKSNFDYHMQDHTNYRPEKCHFEGCDKSFKNKQDLASHIRVHKDIRKYMCDVCGKRFRSQSHMTYHRYAHFPERNFACDQCDQKFKSPHILRTHKNTVHSNVFPYECFCGKKFKRDHHLVAHKKTHNRVGRKTKAKKVEPTEYEVFEFVKEEEPYSIEYTDEQYEPEEFITAEVIEQ